MPDPATCVPKPRKPRPSRARGLRTTTGCLTCRKRRVKCDETKPRCGPCSKSDRECIYGSAYPTSEPAGSTTTPGSQDGTNHATTPSSQASAATSFGLTHPSPATRRSIAGDIDPQLFTNSPELRFDLSPLTITASLPSPNSAPFEWYDLLAEDAVNNIQKHNLGFDQMCLSRRQSPVPVTPESEPLLRSPNQRQPVEPVSTEPWNSPELIPLNDDELMLFQHFVDVVGPMLDLFDPQRHFTSLVPRLAVHNAGLLRSLLAVAARHVALQSDHCAQSALNHDQAAGVEGGTAERKNSVGPFAQVATQYYYETLQYLSQNILYPTYTRSGEIIATAILISTYEMFDAQGSYSDGGWERHLRGIFWIQRSQDNNGESADGLRRAAWWAWIRQDIWVAFRECRRTLTIWRPTKRLMSLTQGELATRIVYIAARCVDYAANEKRSDMSIRIEQGDKLLQALGDWYRILPSSFKPIYSRALAEGNLFSPIWIHPPSHAAAILMFHFARIVVLINQPSGGGMETIRHRQKFLDESVETICGIAMVDQGKDLPIAFVNFQALYAAGLCVQSPAKQHAVLQLLEKTLDISKFPPKSLLADLVKFWRES
ncbi:hypothetical protein B0J11DRAFT_66232 [Dendryphion nanum]|uniref:Zn(2)-C6 fungal-type domain-containing protein n=1 Tax=Dendryphion nanum TaxID=256645 RepID=A0A9P9DJB9_9PLEO|nr:hypothetical protein B0J11DRAFT_66232 [Dendryphion nanum]